MKLLIHALTGLACVAGGLSLGVQSAQAQLRALDSLGQNIQSPSGSAGSQISTMGFGQSGGTAQFGQFGNITDVNQAAQMLGTSKATGFVGADTSDTSNVLSQVDGSGATGAGRTGTARQLGGAANQRASRQNAGQFRSGAAGWGAGGRNARQGIPASLRVAFTADQQTVQGVRNSTAQRLERISRMPQIQQIEPLQISLENGTAVLQGVVASDHDRLLVERLILLEPGVKAVQNDLVVGSEAGQSPSQPEPEAESRSAPRIGPANSGSSISNSPS